MKEKSFAAVIRVCAYNESPQDAINSVCKLSKEIKILYLVDAPEDVKSEFPNTVRVHDLIIDDVQTKYIIDIPPQCTLTQNAFDAVVADIEAPTKKPCTQYSIETATVLNRFSFMHGFLFIMAMINFIRKLLSRQRFHPSNNVTVYPVINVGNKKYYGHDGSVMDYWYNEWCAKTTAPQKRDACICHAEGGEYVWKEMYTEKQFGSAWWGYGVVKIPWWGVPWMAIYGFAWLIATSILINSMLIGLDGKVQTLLFTAVTLAFVLGWAIALHAASKKYKFPRMGWISLGFPVYFTLFPFVLVWARLFAPQKWK